MACYCLASAAAKQQNLVMRTVLLKMLASRNLKTPRHSIHAASSTAPAAAGLQQARSSSNSSSTSHAQQTSASFEADMRQAASWRLALLQARSTRLVEMSHEFRLKGVSFDNRQVSQQAEPAQLKKRPGATPVHHHPITASTSTPVLLLSGLTRTHTGTHPAVGARPRRHFLPGAEQPSRPTRSGRAHSRHAALRVPAKTRSRALAAAGGCAWQGGGGSRHTPVRTSPPALAGRQG